MLDKYLCLEKLARYRRDQVVVSTMSVASPWARLADGPLDFAMVESSMGQAPAFGLGLALARPERRVIVLNGDGSMLMSLGSLVTLGQRPDANLALAIVANGTYEVTGNQPIPGSGHIDFAALARGAGCARVTTVSDDDGFDAALPLLLSGTGLCVQVWRVEPAHEPVPRPVYYIRERIRRLRAAVNPAL
jgi:thiamine pyrophosphate-dependent acetolactate synthase large subunit-like protein